MSKSHQYVEFEENIYERWVKSVTHVVSGLRSNPYKTGEIIPFVLQTRPKNFDYTKINKIGSRDSGMQYTTDEKITFDYEDEVLELYSEVEAKLFRRNNRKLIEMGYLKPYNVTRELADPYAMTDDEITEIAETKNLLAFKKRISSITSAVIMARVIAAVRVADRPQSILLAAQERLHDINEASTT